MRINILQHTSNEGPGAIVNWANLHHHDIYIYHPDQFGIIPSASETEMLIILGGPMSPNDNLPWIHAERKLINELINKNIPIFGICFGAQQIVKTLGGQITKAPAKEVGWGKITRKSTIIPGIPSQLMVLHWHEEMFEIPNNAKLLFSSKGLKNQGFLLNHRIVGLQFHLEPLLTNIREIVINDYSYLKDSIFHQSANEVLTQTIPPENEKYIFQILDYICE